MRRRRRPHVALVCVYTRLSYLPLVFVGLCTSLGASVWTFFPKAAESLWKPAISSKEQVLSRVWMSSAASSPMASTDVSIHFCHSCIIFLLFLTLASFLISLSILALNLPR